MAQTLYHYPQTNQELISQLKLEQHPEGGFFGVTWATDETISSPFAHDVDGQKLERQVASCIYYLLTADQPSNSNNSANASGPAAQTQNSVAKFHLNKSPTMHLHHSGRSLYTLIRAHPPLGPHPPTSAPEIKQVIMGDNLAAGEVRQLLVEGGWWKVSEIPPEDRVAVKEGKADPGRTGALISEVVTPGFHWDDHTFLTRDGFRALFPTNPEEAKKYEHYVPATESS